MTQRIVRPPRTRRELLKLTPLAALGAMLYQPWRESILDKGHAFQRLGLGPDVSTDSSRANLQRRGRRSLRAVPLQLLRHPRAGNRFRRLVPRGSGKVSRPGKYSLDQLQPLPKVTQNTRHVCVEGWDAIGSFGGARLERLPGSGWRGSSGPLRRGDVRRRLLRVDRSRHGATSADAALLRDVRQAARSRSRRAAAAADPDQLGYKQAKYLMTLSVVNELGAEQSYWGDQGYSWYGGI